MGRDAELNGISISALGDGELALGGSSHSFFINGAHHHTSAIGAS